MFIYVFGYLWGTSGLICVNQCLIIVCLRSSAFVYYITQFKITRAKMTSRRVCIIMLWCSFLAFVIEAQTLIEYIMHEYIMYTQRIIYIMHISNIYIFFSSTDVIHFLLPLKKKKMHCNIYGFWFSAKLFLPSY